MAWRPAAALASQQPSLLEARIAHDQFLLLCTTSVHVVPVHVIYVLSNCVKALRGAQLVALQLAVVGCVLAGAHVEMPLDAHHLAQVCQWQFKSAPRFQMV
jgi:hypothetical protein